MVALVAPADVTAAVWGQGEIDALLLAALGRGSVKDAAREVAERTRLPRRDLYNRALVLRDGEEVAGADAQAEALRSPAGDE